MKHIILEMIDNNYYDLNIYYDDNKHVFCNHYDELTPEDVLERKDDSDKDEICFDNEIFISYIIDCIIFNHLNN